MSLKIGIQPSSVTPPALATAAATDDSRSSTVKKFRQDAHAATRSLIDFGPQTGLMMRLAAAADGKGSDWQALREEVRSNLPRDPGSLELSFKKAFEQAEASAGAPGSTAYTSALKQLKTAFTMARVLERLT
jgi:hypothetical protein